jgi:hypothetical protein
MIVRGSPTWTGSRSGTPDAGSDCLRGSGRGGRRRSVTVQHLGAIGAGGGGGPVAVQGQRPAPFVNRDEVVERAEQFLRLCTPRSERTDDNKIHGLLAALRRRSGSFSATTKI